MDILTKAKWSDAFFNYPEAEAAFSCDLDHDRKAVFLRQAAEMFVKAHPDCPMNADELVKDFEERV